MSFHDDIIEPPDDEPAPRRVAWNTAELDEPTKAKIRANSMAALCASIPESDWVLLQALSERTRHAVLKWTLEAMFRKRPAG